MNVTKFRAQYPGGGFAEFSTLADAQKTAPLRVDTVVERINARYGTKEEVIRAIRAHAEELRKNTMTILDGHSMEELLAWSVKRDEALEHIRTLGISAVPILAIEAQTSGRTTMQVAQAYKTKTDAWLDKDARISGAKETHIAAVTALTGDAALDYDFSTGWPV